MSTYYLRGFITIPKLHNNEPEAVAPFGELSKQAMTYSKESGRYVHPGFEDVALWSFDSRMESGELIEVPDDYSFAALEVGQYIYEWVRDKLLDDNSYNTVQRLETQLGNYIADFVVGNMLSNGDGFYPDWLSFRLNNSDSYVRLWFSDDAFRLQYGQYEYAFVGPVDNLDDLMGTEAQVRAAIALKPFKKIADNIEKVRNDYPYTRLVARDYAWVGPDGTEVPLDWAILVYGLAGVDLDRLRQALAQWILDNSSYTREEWLDRLPDIFAPTEFIITPLWHRYAIPNRTVQAGVHSPWVKLNDIDKILVKTLKGVGYGPQQRFKHTTIANNLYKSLAVMFTGSANNRDDIHLIEKHFPDFFLVSDHRPDFARISPHTQQWMRYLAEMFYIAESMTRYSVIPTGFYRVQRDGVTYVGREYDGILYMMVSRFSMHDFFEPEYTIRPDAPLSDEIVACGCDEDDEDTSAR